MEDGDTIVIGGILKDTKKLTDQGIPGLRKLPAMGWLFRSERTELSKNELLIFITPRIIQMEQRRAIYSDRFHPKKMRMAESAIRIFL